jgi:hypothetical protein
MQTIREEVQAFVRATETLLSPIMLGRPLNEDERGMVAMCGQSLAERYSKAEDFPDEESQDSEKENLLHRSHQVAIETQAVIETSAQPCRP